MRLKLSDTISGKFCKLPKDLFSNPIYKGKLDNNTITAYAFLKDRFSLSKKHGWVNKLGEVFINFRRSELAKTINVSLSTMTKIFKKLISVGLIQEERFGQGRVNEIYLCHEQCSIAKEKEESIINEDFTCVESTYLDTEIVVMNEIQPTPTPATVVEDKKAPSKTDKSNTNSLKDLSKDGLKTIYDNCEIENYDPDIKIFLKKVIKFICTYNKVYATLGITEEELKECMSTLRMKHIDKARFIYKQYSVNSNPQLYFAKCLISAITDFGVEEERLLDQIENPVVEKPKGYSAYINFDQRPMETGEFDKYYNYGI